MKRFLSTLTLNIVLTTFFSLRLLIAQANTLSESWRWVKFSTESGLPSDRVFDVIETRSGDTWAVTQSGLAWFNGYYWEPVGQDKGLPEKMLSQVILDDNDSLLVLSEYLVYYGGKQGFHQMRITENGKKKPVTQIAPFGNEGYLFICDFSLYLYWNGLVKPYLLPPELHGQKIIELYFTKGRTLWLNTSDGLYRWDGSAWSQKLKNTGLPFGIRLFAEDMHGNGLAFIVYPKKYFGLWECRQHTSLVHNPKQSSDNILALDFASDDQALIVKESDEVIIRHGSKWSSMEYPPPQLRNILFIKFRDNGDIWAGTETGLYLHNTTSKRWTIWKYPSPDNRNNINEILQTKDGSVWVGTTKGIQIHRPDGKIEDIQKLFDRELGVITGLAEDADNNVWIGSGSSFNGAYRWDGFHWKYFGINEGLDVGNIHKIVRDRQGRPWFLGLERNDYNNRKVEREPGAYLYSNGRFIPWGTKQGLANGRVYAFTEDADGAYWFGTNNGMSRWKPNDKDRSRGVWTHWTIDRGLKMNKVFTIASGPKNEIWFGDQNNGLGFMDGDTPRYITIEDGLVSNAVWDIRVDTRGKLWISTRGGVAVYNNGTFSSFDMGKGLENTRIWPVLPTKDRAYIGTSGGGVMILNFGGYNDTNPKLILYNPIIEENNVLLHWRVFSWWGEQISDDIETRHKIDDGEWSKWERDRHIIIGNVSAGDHDFQIQTKNVFGNYESSGKSISFTIPPPLYLQPKYYLPVGTLSLGIIIIGWIYFIKKKRQDTELKRSEIRYKNLFDTASDAIIIFEPKGKIILGVNNKSCELYGFTKDEFVGMNIKLISKSVGYEEEMIQHAQRNSRGKVFDAVHISKSGAEIYLHINASVIDYDGKEAILSLNRDITEQRQAEARIRLLAQTVASAQDYVSITDLKDNILFVNDAFAKAYGYTPDELYGKNISVVRSPLTPQEITSQILQATIKECWNGELYNRRKDGTDFAIELWASVVRNELNEPVALVGVARNITERKQYEEERDHLIAELKQALADVKYLSGLLPICSSCKKIRDDKGYWTQVETYFEKHSEATFTHGLCPDCTKQYFPEIYNKVKDKNF